MDNKTQQIAALNDHCRQCVMMPVFGQRPCKVFMTQGIAALPPEDQIIIVVKVRDYDDFSEIQIIERNPSLAIQPVIHGIMYWEVLSPTL